MKTLFFCRKCATTFFLNSNNVQSKSHCTTEVLKSAIAFSKKTYPDKAWKQSDHVRYRVRNDRSQTRPNMTLPKPRPCLRALLPLAALARAALGGSADSQRADDGGVRMSYVELSDCHEGRRLDCNSETYHHSLAEQRTAVEQCLSKHASECRGGELRVTITRTVPEMCNDTTSNGGFRAPTAFQPEINPADVLGPKIASMLKGPKEIQLTVFRLHLHETRQEKATGPSCRSTDAYQVAVASGGAGGSEADGKQAYCSSSSSFRFSEDRLPLDRQLMTYTAGALTVARSEKESEEAVLVVASDKCTVGPGPMAKADVEYLFTSRVTHNASLTPPVTPPKAVVEKRPEQVSPQAAAKDSTTLEAQRGDDNHHMYDRFRFVNCGGDGQGGGHTHTLVCNGRPFDNSLGAVVNCYKEYQAQCRGGKLVGQIRWPQARNRCRNAARSAVFRLPLENEKNELGKALKAAGVEGKGAISVVLTNVRIDKLSVGACPDAAGGVKAFVLDEPQQNVSTHSCSAPAPLSAQSIAPSEVHRFQVHPNSPSLTDHSVKALAIRSYGSCHLAPHEDAIAEILSEITILAPPLPAGETENTGGSKEGVEVAEEVESDGAPTAVALKRRLNSAGFEKCPNNAQISRSFDSNEEWIPQLRRMEEFFRSNYPRCTGGNFIVETVDSGVPNTCKSSANKLLFRAQEPVEWATDREAYRQLNMDVKVTEVILHNYHEDRCPNKDSLERTKVYFTTPVKKQPACYDAVSPGKVFSYTDGRGRATSTNTPYTKGGIIIVPPQGCPISKKRVTANIHTTYTGFISENFTDVPPAGSLSTASPTSASTTTTTTAATSTSKVASRPSSEGGLDSELGEGSRLGSEVGEGSGSGSKLGRGSGSGSGSGKLKESAEGTAQSDTPATEQKGKASGGKGEKGDKGEKGAAADAKGDAALSIATSTTLTAIAVLFLTRP